MGLARAPAPPQRHRSTPRRTGSSGRASRTEGVRHGSPRRPRTSARRAIGNFPASGGDQSSATPSAEILPRRCCPRGGKTRRAAGVVLPFCSYYVRAAESERTLLDAPRAVSPPDRGSILGGVSWALFRGPPVAVGIAPLAAPFAGDPAFPQELSKRGGHLALVLAEQISEFVLGGSGWLARERLKDLLADSEAHRTVTGVGLADQPPLAVVEVENEYRRDLRPARLATSRRWREGASSSSRSSSITVSTAPSSAVEPRGAPARPW